MHATTLLIATLAATLLPGTSAASLCRPPSPSKLRCQDIVIPVDVSATNLRFPQNFTLSSPGALPNDLLATLPTLVAGGRFSLSARYCPPTRHVPSRATTLQVLVHGITYDKDYWTGLAPPAQKPGQERYSWVDFAAAEGYPTLAVDRLCNGHSTRPNGLLECQVPLQAETMHAVIAAARAGTLPGLNGTAFSRVLYVGHSYGSLVASGLAVQHPTGAGTPDALVLTGFTDQLLFGEVGVTVEPQWVPAAVGDPARFGSDDPSYIYATSKDGAKELFYFGDFDAKVLDFDFAHRQTTTLGELGTVTLGQLRAPGYGGPVFVLNGDHDAIFCEPNLASPLIRQPGDCTDQVDAGVKDFFPAASVFKYANMKNTGHCLNLHFSSQVAFKTAHDWLAQAGY